jgi:hypothetical protein
MATVPRQVSPRVTLEAVDMATTPMEQKKTLINRMPDPKPNSSFFDASDSRPFLNGSE